VAGQRVPRLVTVLAAVAVLVGLTLPRLAQAQAWATVEPGTEVYRIQTREKVVALTFDDAWIDANLKSILATLKADGVKATFFPTGYGVESSPELARQIAADGHELGSHSYTHSKLEAMTTAELLIQIQMTEEAFSSVGLPDPVPLFRAPWGEVNSKVLKVLGGEGYANIMWTARGGDTVAHRSPAQVTVTIMNDVRPGVIIVMHTGNDVTPKALPELIRRIKAAGYRFVTLGEALFSSQQRMLRYEQSSPLLTYTGDWSTRSSPLEMGGSLARADGEGAVALASFTGSTFEILAATGPDLGKVSVTIDGGVPREVDLYSATEQHRAAVFSAADLAGTTHTALISWTGTKNRASTGYAIDIDAVRVSGALTQAPAPVVYLLSRFLSLVLAPYRQ
jgi:peptidoglycan/xylan/chitin deacetylase (PgdA/CDA1 family)